MKKAFRPAFTATIPVLCGYLFIGFAFGVMLRDIGFGSIWSFFCSLSIYAGSGQYLLVSLLAAKASLVTVAVMTLLLNCRHIFYGLSFLETFHEMGHRKWYMIFSLTDETYSLLCSVKTPEGIDAGDMRFWIAILDQSYWILGSVLGTIIGGVLPLWVWLRQRSRWPSSARAISSCLPCSRSASCWSLCAAVWQRRSPDYDNCLRYRDDRCGRRLHLCDACRTVSAV